MMNYRLFLSAVALAILSMPASGQDKALSDEDAAREVAALILSQTATRVLRSVLVTYTSALADIPAIDHSELEAMGAKAAFLKYQPLSPSNNDIAYTRVGGFVGSDIYPQQADNASSPRTDDIGFHILTETSDQESITYSGFAAGGALRRDTSNSHAINWETAKFPGTEAAILLAGIVNGFSEGSTAVSAKLTANSREFELEAEFRDRSLPSMQLKIRGLIANSDGLIRVRSSLILQEGRLRHLHMEEGWDANGEPEVSVTFSPSAPEGMLQFRGQMQRKFIPAKCSVVGVLMKSIETAVQLEAELKRCGITWFRQESTSRPKGL